MSCGPRPEDLLRGPAGTWPRTPECQRRETKALAGIRLVVNPHLPPGVAVLAANRDQAVLIRDLRP